MTATVRKIRRILVDLDSSASSMEALRVAAALAGTFGAELRGAFVEDSELLSFSALPFATLTGAVSPKKVRMGETELLRAFRSQAERCRQALASAARERGVAWSFRVLRGNVDEQLREAAREVDVISLGRVGLSARRREHTREPSAATSPNKLVRVEKGARFGAKKAPVIVVASQGERAIELLEVGAALATSQQRPLKIVVPQGGEERAFMRRVEGALSGWPVQPRWIILGSRSLGSVLREALVERGGVLVIFEDDPFVSDRRIVELVERSACSLILLR